MANNKNNHLKENHTWHRLFKKVTLRLVVISLFLLLLIPAISLLLKYSKEKRYMLEVNSEEQVIVKYRIKEDSSFFDMDAGKEEISREDLFYQDLNNYYTAIAEEYGIDEEPNFEENSKTSAKTLAEDGIQGSSNSSLELSKENLQFVGDINNFQVLNKFSGLESSDASQPFFQEEEEYVLELDKQGLDEQALNYFFKKKNLSPSLGTNKEKALTLTKKFYTSPPPSPTKENTADSLSSLSLILDKELYYSFELVWANIVSPKSVNIQDLRVYLRRGKYLIPNIGGRHDFFFKYKDKTIRTALALGYHPAPGEYHVEVRSSSNPSWKGLSQSFFLKRRKVAPLKKGFAVMNLEYTNPLKSITIPAPGGGKAGYSAIVDWVEYMDNDALWALAAQTTGWDRSLTAAKPWKAQGLKNIKLLGPLTRKKNILLGAYIMSYFTPANGKKLAGYNASIGYSRKKDVLQDTRHISLLDEQRRQDIVEIAKTFESDPYVDFIGFDFIRTGRADGYEMGLKFLEEMNVRLPKPKDFYTFSPEDKIKWFGRHVENQSNRSLILKWRWWRAHLVASIINSVIIEAKLTKPSWVFTLGWRHGKEHGQDPYMFFDAGVMIDAAMLYESNRQQFAKLMQQWPNYMRTSANNVMIGNAIDIRFLDSDFANVPYEYLYRMKKGFRKIYRDSYAKGIFSHDISRAFWSSKRGIEVSEWAVVHGSATSEFRYELGLIPYRAEVAFSPESQEEGSITVTNKSKNDIEKLSLIFSPTPAWQLVEDTLPFSFGLAVGESKTFHFKAKLRKGFKNKENILGYYAESPDFPRYFFFTVSASQEKLDRYLAYIK